MQGETSRVLSYLLTTRFSSKKVIFEKHERSLDGGVAITMSRVRSLFWILHLRRISKSVIRNCPGCKKFRNLSYHSTNQGLFPKDRTEKCFLFEGTDRDYAGPIYNKTKRKFGTQSIYIYFAAYLKPYK